MHFALFLALFGFEKIDKNMDLYVNTKNSRFFFIAYSSIVSRDFSIFVA